MIHIDRFYKKISRLTLTLGLIAMFGAPLCAETWYFAGTTLPDTTIVGTRSGDATVEGYVTLTGLDWTGPTDIVLTGPFGTFTDLGAQLQLDEGDKGWTDSTVLFIAQVGTSTQGLTVDPLISFTFTSVFAGSLITDTYSLVSGELTTVNPTPEPGTAPLMLIGALAVGAAFRLRRS
jgi:hypothetical protein